MYPFIACAVCGPRFTTVKELPYDRERSTMIEFPLCEHGTPSCVNEYSNFNNRRFHAQTFACSVCGPNYQLYNKSKEIIEKDSIQRIIKSTAKKINEGEIVAVKGIGGYHLLCDASSSQAVARLRQRKHRPDKPLAVMFPFVVWNVAVSSLS